LSRERPGWYVATSVVYHPRPSGQGIPDLKTESHLNRLPLYRHYYSNQLETHLRHCNRFGKGWFLGYALRLVHDARTFILRGHWDRLRIVISGSWTGFSRGIRHALLSGS
jgi:hypothetical protein